MPIRTVAAERSAPASRVLAVSILCVAMTVATEAVAAAAQPPANRRDQRNRRDAATGPPPMPARRAPESRPLRERCDLPAGRRTKELRATPLRRRRLECGYRGHRGAARSPRSDGRGHRCSQAQGRLRSRWRRLHLPGRRPREFEPFRAGVLSPVDLPHTLAPRLRLRRCTGVRDAGASAGRTPLPAR